MGKIGEEFHVNKKKIRLLALFLMSLVCILLMLLMASTQSARADSIQNGTPEPPVSTPTPPPPGGTSTPAPTTGGSLSKTVTEVFYNLVFPAQTVGDALGKVFTDMATGQTNSLVGDYAKWYQAIGEIIQAPSAGVYSTVAHSSWPVAAALAPALFILRIALYNWNRLLGEEDSAQKAAGDII